MVKNSQQSKTIVVGMSGRIDSAVAAYLLKKQGYRCIGVGISLIDPDIFPGNEFGHCQVKDLRKVQKICDNLGIPFYGVNAQAEFKDLIIDAVISARLYGEYFDYCSACHALKIKILCEKAKLLKADGVATGHYAKINFNAKTKEYQILSALDASHDQAYFLSRMDYENYSMLQLPLGDMRQHEVVKIAEGLGVKEGGDSHRCFPRGPAFIEMVSKLAPASLVRKGQLINLEDKSVFCDHAGIHHYHMGQDNIQGAIDIVIPPEFRVVHIDYFSGNVFLSPSPTPYYFSYCQVTQFKTPAHLDSSKPLKACVQFASRGERYECNIFFKTHNNAFITFPKPLSKLLVRGQVLTVYKGPSSNAPIIGNGLLRSFGIDSELDRLKAVREKEKVKVVEE